MKDDEREIQVQEDEEVSAKTIVGGRPLKRRSVKMSIPAGIEKTLYKAAIDPGFRSELMQDRFGAIEAHGFRLTPMERTMLQSIPDSRLQTIISRIRPEKHGKRKFMKAVATAVVTLATGTATVSCDEMSAGGIMPDDTATEADTTDVIADTGVMDAGGALPDVPEDSLEDLVIDTSEDGAVEGIMPDAPEDVSDALDDVEDGGDLPDADEGDADDDV